MSQDVAYKCDDFEFGKDKKKLDHLYGSCNRKYS